jgi:lambda repressor-like predicted transcriptional regulator
VTAPPSQVWTDRAREISKLREQGETLANIGRRFGLSAERVWQILLQEDQATPNLVGAEQALDDNVESARRELEPVTSWT